MLLDLLRPHMNVNDSEVFSVYPGRFNNPTDLIKGRTFRRLNVTRKILIKDIPSLLTTALNMQTFCLGQRCLSQLRGSPMGSPLSPALCAMVVSISEQIWAGQPVSNRSLPTIIFLFVTFAMLTIVWSLVTLKSSAYLHMSFFWMTAFMESPLFWRLSRIKSSWASCLKPTHWN